jgi:hypothetical protein
MEDPNVEDEGGLGPRHQTPKLSKITPMISRDEMVG